MAHLPLTPELRDIVELISDVQQCQGTPFLVVNTDEHSDQARVRIKLDPGAMFAFYRLQLAKQTMPAQRLIQLALKAPATWVDGNGHEFEPAYAWLACTNEGFSFKATDSQGKLLAQSETFTPGQLSEAFTEGEVLDQGGEVDIRVGQAASYVDSKVEHTVLHHEKRHLQPSCKY